MSAALTWDTRTAIVIGASSGIGAALVKRLARAGWTVAAVARRGEMLRALAAKENQRAQEERVLVYEHDVRDFDAVPALFERIVGELGGVQMVVYAAGTMPEVAADEYDFAKDRAMVEVNLLGMMAWLNPAAELFERLHGGIIVGIGSIAGDRGRRGQPGYNTSKGAQAIFLESLRNRLWSSGVRVVTIKPGYVATAMTKSVKNPLWIISADEAARRILLAAATANAEVYVPRRWRLVALIIRHIPSVIFRRLEI